MFERHVIFSATVTRIYLEFCDLDYTFKACMQTGEVIDVEEHGYFFTKDIQRPFLTAIVLILCLVVRLKCGVLTYSIFT